jgi:outer membrane murein-binding lipoprotein Lpp
MVQDLNSMVDDLNARMAYLARECPADWSDDEAAIEDKMTQLRGKWKEVWGAMGEHEYGLGGA